MTKKLKVRAEVSITAAAGKTVVEELLNNKRAANQLKQVSLTGKGEA